MIFGISQFDILKKRHGIKKACTRFSHLNIAYVFFNGCTLSGEMYTKKGGVT
jgi:hypothetical protein